MKIQDIILVIFFISAVIFVVWYIIGGSPTFEQAILILILGLVISNTVNINGLKIKLNSYIKNNNEKFNALALDFKKHVAHKK